MEASAVAMMIFGLVFLWGGFGICVTKAIKNSK